MTMLSVPCKILEQRVYARVEPVVDPSLSREEADIQHGRSTVQHVTLPTLNIIDGFSAKL